LAGSLKNSLSFHVMNIADREAVQALPDEVEKIHGPIDGLINNAGIIQRFVRVNDLDYQEMERVMNVNFWGTLNMVKAFLPQLLRRPEAHIVNVSSMGSYLPVPGQTIYGASKAAVNALTDGLNSELMNTNVHVTTVYPGATATNITVNSGVAMPANDVNTKQMAIKMTSAVNAARIIADGMESNAYHVFVGQDARFMNFLVRLAPKRAAKLIYTQMRGLLPD
jgi:short-subunit dehydrogenase